MARFVRRPGAVAIINVDQITRIYVAATGSNYEGRAYLADGTNHSVTAPCPTIEDAFTAAREFLVDAASADASLVVNVTVA